MRHSFLQGKPHGRKGAFFETESQGIRRSDSMCEANAFLLKGDAEEKVLENVDELEVDGDTVRMVNIFGEQKSLRARVKRYNNSEGKILLVAC